MDKWDFTALKFWLDAGQWIATMLLAVWMWIDKRRRDNSDQIEVLKTNQGELSDRVIKMEAYISNAPDHEDIAALREQNAALQSKLDRVTDTLDRIHDYLMNNRG